MKRIDLFLFWVSAMVLVPGCPPGSVGNNDDDGGGPGLEVSFTATFSGAQEAPPVESDGTGSGTFTLNTAGTVLSYEITASGLSGPVTLAHFHIGPPGVSGGIVFEITDAITEDEDGNITAAGEWQIDAADVTALLDGDIYVNLHTAAHPAGEIRGQLVEVE